MQYDFDGEFEKSNIEKVDLDNNISSSNLVIYPNPFIANLTIFSQDKENDLSLVIQDLTGKIVYKSEGIINETQINLSHLESEIYFVETLQNGKSTSAKIVKI